MPEALVSAISVIFALIGLITVIYSLLVRLVLFGRRQKILLILPAEEEEDAGVAFACSNMLKAYPLFSGDMFEITVASSNATTDVNILNDTLETESTKQV